MRSAAAALCISVVGAAEPLQPVDATTGVDEVQLHATRDKLASWADHRWERILIDDLPTDRFWHYRYKQPPFRFAGAPIVDVVIDGRGGIEQIELEMLQQDCEGVAEVLARNWGPSRPVPGWADARMWIGRRVDATFQTDNIGCTLTLTDVLSDLNTSAWRYPVGESDR